MSLQIWLPLNKKNDSDQTKIINNGLRDDIEIKHDAACNTMVDDGIPEGCVSMCYGNNKLVALPNSATTASNIVMYSTDDITWSKAILPAVMHWQAICYGNGKFVATSYNSNIVAYSTDGVTWNKSTLPATAYWSKICYGNGKFVALGSDYDKPNNIVAYSTDGITWTKSTLPATACWYTICYGNGKFVAIPFNSNIAAYSTDGITWTKTTMPTTAYWEFVCYGNGKFVAVSSQTSNIAAYSTDGITWTKTTLLASTDWYSVCYNNGKFVAMGTNTSAYSTDGITWTGWRNATNNLTSHFSFFTACYGSNNFVALSRSTKDCIYSPDGITWYNNNPCPVYTNAVDRIGGLAADKNIYIENSDIFTDKMSIAFRLYCSDYNGNTIISDCTDTIRIIARTSAGSDNGTIDVTINGTINVTSDSLLVKNTWNHVAIIIDMDNSIKIYINGKYAGTTAISDSFSSSSNSFNLVYHDACKTAGYKIQDYRIYDELLLPEEIEELALDVIAHYPLDDIAMMNCPDEFCGTYNREGALNTNTDVSFRTDQNGESYYYSYNNISSEFALLYTNAVPFDPFNKYYLVKLMFKAVNLSNKNNKLYLKLFKYKGDANPDIKELHIHKMTFGIWNEINLYNDSMLNYSAVYNSEEDRVMYGEYVNNTFKEYRPFVAITTNNLDDDAKFSIKNLQLMAVPTNNGYIPFNFNAPLMNLYRTSGFGAINTYRVCYGNGKFVATTYNSNIAGYSTDGINWNKTTLPASGYWGNLCYGNGKFVAICANWNSNNKSNIAAYSTDGITWTKTTLPTSSNYQAICYGNGKFVTITYSAGIGAYSTDGIKWTQFTLPSLDTGGYIDITYGNGKFIMISYNNNVAAYSTDGITWIKTKLPIIAYWQAICYGNGKFVAVAYNSDLIAYSTDGITWSHFINSYNSTGFSSIIYANGYFIACSQGSSAAIAYSTDGIIWENYYNAASPINWAAYHDGLFVFACTKGIYAARDKYYFNNTLYDKILDWSISGSLQNKSYKLLVANSNSYSIVQYNTENSNIKGALIGSGIGDIAFKITGSANKMSNLFKIQNRIYAIDTVTHKIWKMKNDGVMKETSSIINTESDLSNVYPITDKWNHIIAISPDTALYGTVDSLVKTSEIDSKYYGNYLSENIGNISIFVYKEAVPESQIYCGVCVVTNETGIEKVFNIVLPVRPPYIDIIVRKEQFIVVPVSGNELCVSKDGSKWDSIIIPYNKTWTCCHYGNNNLDSIFLLASSDKNVYYTYDLINWHNLILNPVPEQPIQCILSSDSQLYLYTKSKNQSTNNIYHYRYSYGSIHMQINVKDISDYNIGTVLDYTTGFQSSISKISPSGQLSLPSLASYMSIRNNIITNVCTTISTSFWIKVDWRNLAITHCNIITDIHFYDNGNLEEIGPHYSEFDSDKWYLITLIINQNTKRYSLYINLNKVLENKEYTYDLSIDRIQFGGGYNSYGADRVATLISDIKIYGKLLTQEDVEHIYNTTAGLSIYKDGGIKAANYTENSFSENLLLSENNYSDFEFYKTNGTKTIINPSVHNRIVKYTYTEASDNIFSGLILEHDLSEKLYTAGKVLLSFYAYSNELTEARIFAGAHLDDNDAHHLITLTKPNQEKILNRILFKYNGWSSIYIETDHKNGDSIYIDSMSLQVLPAYDDEQMYLDQYGRLSINEITESDQYNSVEIVNGNVYTNKIR